MIDDIKLGPSGRPGIEHEHRWFMANTKKDFEPMVKDGEFNDLYLMVEYAYLVCNCATVIKTKVLGKEELNNG